MGACSITGGVDNRRMAGIGKSWAQEMGGGFTIKCEGGRELDEGMRRKRPMSTN